MTNGWVKLWRQIEDSQVWQNPHLLHVWVYCLLRTNHAPKWVPVHGLVEPVLVGAGQFITGRFALHAGLYPKKKKTNPSPSTAWRWLQTLASMRNLNIQTNSRFTMVTICNWERYQNTAGQNEQANEQPVNSRRTAGEQPVNTNKNDKNVENDKKIVWSREDGWANITPEHHKEWAEAFPAVDLPRQLAAMAVWCRANPAKARKSNWARFIANWLSKAQDKGGDVRSNHGDNGDGHTTEHDRTLARYEREAAGKTEETR